MEIDSASNIVNKKWEVKDFSNEEKKEWLDKGFSLEGAVEFRERNISPEEARKILIEEIKSGIKTDQSVRIKDGVYSFNVIKELISRKTIKEFML